MNDPIDRMAQGQLHRRAVLKAAAWSAPAVALAVSTPLASASVTSNVDLGVSFTGSSLDIREDIISALQAWRESLGVVTSLLLAVPITALIAAIRVAGSVINAGYDYPSELIVTNIDPESTLTAGQTANVALVYGADVLDVGALNLLVNIDVIATESGASATIVAASDVPPGGEVARIPLQYNPVTIGIDLAGSSQDSGTATAVLTGDASENGNTATSPYGVFVDILPGLSPLIAAITAIVPLPPISIVLFS